MVNGRGRQSGVHGRPAVAILGGGMASRSIPRPMVAIVAFLAAAVTAQEPSLQQVPLPVVTPTPAPGPTVAAPPVVLATPTLTPRPGIDDVPTPVFVPNARPTPASARPTPTVTPAASPSATPTISPTPTPSATNAAPLPIETVILPQQRDLPAWVWVAGGAALLLILLGWLGLRRQRDVEDEDGWEDEVVEEAVPPGTFIEPIPARSDDRARLSVALRPTRAGLNLISATAECEVTIVNLGKLVAEDVRASLRLMSARDGQEAELAAFYADTGGRPATPTFSLAPGEERRFRAVTALPHDAIHSIDAGGRPMFVPLVGLSVRYRDGEGLRRVGQAFMLGVDQGGSAKLAPFWLDGPARSYEQVGARPHGEPMER